MIYRIVWSLFRLVFTVFCRYRIRGAHNIPTTGPALVACNHISLLDPPVVAVGVWRPMRFMAKEELFKGAFGWLIDQLGAFPVRRGAADSSALKRSLEILKAGKVLMIFPEGTRSETGELQQAEMGVGMIAYRTGVPVIPSYLSGSDRAMPRGGGIRPARISITYGEPLRFVAPEGTKPGRAEYEAAAQAIMAAIAALRDADAQQR